MQWLHDVNTGEVAEFYKVEQLDRSFRIHRNKFISEVLHEILIEQIQDNGNVTDEMDKEI